MDASPKGRDIRRISGNAGDITARGTQMESLGTQMREAANLLKLMKDGVQGKGYSVDSIVDAAGDVHTDLGRAGERYEPSGRVVKEYGQALSSVQPTIDRVVSDCEDLWATYVSKRGAADDAASATPPPDETDEAKTTREQGVQTAQGDADAAYRAWQDEAEKYDTPYDTWDTAYDAAYHGLKDANDDGVHDSWLDNALPGIEIALEVLKWVGLALAVAAIIIGGPILALAALVVGVLSLVLTIAKVAGGRGGAMDIVMAVVGILPFGKLGVLGKLFKGEKLGSVLAQFGKGVAKDITGISAIQQIKAVRNVPGALRALQPLNKAGNLRGMAGTRAQLTNAAGTWERQVSLIGKRSYATPSQIGNRFLNGKTASLEQAVGNISNGLYKGNQARLQTILANAGIENWAKGAAKSRFEQSANLGANVYSLYRNEQKVQGAVQSYGASQQTAAQQSQWALQLAQP